MGMVAGLAPAKAEANEFRRREQWSQWVSLQDKRVVGVANATVPCQASAKEARSSRTPSPDPQSACIGRPRQGSRSHLRIKWTMVSSPAV